MPETEVLVHLIVVLIVIAMGVYSIAATPVFGLLVMVLLTMKENDPFRQHHVWRASVFLITLLFWFAVYLVALAAFGFIDLKVLAEPTSIIGLSTRGLNFHPSVVFGAWAFTVFGILMPLRAALRAVNGDSPGYPIPFTFRFPGFLREDRRVSSQS